MNYQSDEVVWIDSHGATAEKRPWPADHNLVELLAIDGQAIFVVRDGEAKRMTIYQAAPGGPIGARETYQLEVSGEGSSLAMFHATKRDDGSWTYWVSIRQGIERWNGGVRHRLADVRQMERYDAAMYHVEPI